MKKIFSLFVVALFAMSAMADNYLPGDWNSWSMTEDAVKFDFSAGTTGTLTLSLAANTTYNFKINDGTNLYGNGGTMNTFNHTGWTFGVDNTAGGACKITTWAAGNYTFSITWNGSIPTLSVTYPPFDWSTISYLGDGAGGGTYSNKYKVGALDAANLPGVVNIQNKNGNAAIYLTFPAANIACDYAHEAEGAGMYLFIDQFVAKETEVIVTYAGGSKTFMVYYENGIDGYLKKNANYAQNGTASASSGTAALGNDNNTGTRWESAQSDPQWWQVDLGRKCAFNAIQIVWEGAYGKSFTISASDNGTDWTVISTITDQTLAGFPNTQTIDIDQTAARYVRFDGTARGTQYGYSFWEFKVLQRTVSVLTTLNLTAGASLAQVGAEVTLNLVAKDQVGIAMEAGEINWVVTPSTAGHVANGKYIADQTGAATIKAVSGAIESAEVSVFAYAGNNLSLSTNIDNDNKIIAQSDFTPNGTNAYYAIDSDEGSVWQGSATAGGSDAEADRTFDCWFVVDLGSYYDIELVTIKFEGACSQLYHIDFAETYNAASTVWRTAYNYVGNAGINGHTDYWYGNVLDSKKVRYVRFFSTKAATQWGMKIYDMKVIGTAWVPASDTEAPVMTSATLVSTASTNAIIAVAATDNEGVAAYHVVDAAHAIDATLSATDGKITVTGLTASTTYNFVITAVDMNNNESANSKTVAATTKGTAPSALPTAPTYAATKVKAIYSATYSADCDFGEWGSATTCTADTYGKKYVLTNSGYFGMLFTGLNCAAMEYLHLDVWCANATSLGIVPIHGGTEVRVTKNLTAGEWTSIDIPLSDFAGVTNWTNVYQLKIDQISNQTIWLNNVYFYTTAAADVTKPVTTAASVDEVSYVTASLNVTGTDDVAVASALVKTAADVTIGTFAINNDKILVTGLTAGTAYTNAKVYVVDASNNVADNFVEVSFTTLAYPAAQIPSVPADLVKALYSDAYALAPASIRSYNEGWWNNPQLQEVELTTGQHALMYYGNNLTNGMIGWEFAPFDATGYDKFHVDVYVTKTGQMKFGPTYGGPEKTTAVYNQAGIINLVAGWNAIDLDLSGKDLTSIFQMQFTDYGTSNFGSFFVDNAYFYKSSYVRDGLTAGNYGTLCLPYAATLEGATAYTVASTSASQITIVPVVGNLVAGTPYIIKATASDLVATFQGEPVNAPVNTGVLKGNLSETPVELNNASNAYILSADDNQFHLISGTATATVGQYRAYLQGSLGSAPIRIVETTDVATSLEDNNAQENVEKFIENGQIFIRKNGVVYNTLGQAIK